MLTPGKLKRINNFFFQMLIGIAEFGAPDGVYINLFINSIKCVSDYSLKQNKKMKKNTLYK